MGTKLGLTVALMSLTLYMYISHFLCVDLVLINI